MRNLFLPFVFSFLALLTTSSAIPQSPAVVNLPCTPDDMVDDTACIQASIDDLSPGETLLFGPGTYNYTGQLFVTNHEGVTLQGDQTHLHATTDKDQALTIEDSTNVRVTGFRFTSLSWKREQADRRSSILVYRSDGVEIDNNLIEHSAGAGIHISQATTNYHIHDNEIHDTFADGIHNTNRVSNALIENNLVYGTGDDAIAFVGYERNGDHIRNVTVQNNYISNTRWGRGITIEGTVNATVDGNFIGRTDAACILIASNNTSTYVHLDNEEVLVSNNILEYCNTSAEQPGRTLHGAIYLDGRQNYENKLVTIYGNTVFDTVNGSAHVRINAFNLDVLVAGNQISDLTFKRRPFQLAATAQGEVLFDGNTYNGSVAP